MSIHPSLNSSEKNRKIRSVLKRIERLRLMAEKNQWKEGDDIYGLPKIKTIRIKIKKEKAAKETAETTATAATAEGTAPAAGASVKEPATKGQATTAKSQDKK